MSIGFRLAAIWLAGSSFALLAALTWAPAVFVDGDVLLTGHDSFYHARRILDALANPFLLQQFDPHIEAPAGAWVPWPWGFDMLMALLVSAGVALGAASEPLRVLVYLPPLWSLLNAALVLCIVRSLGMNLLLCAAAMLCFAMSPLTQEIHGLGRVDHHFAELSVVLLCLLGGLRWAARPASRSRCIALGGLLGAVTVIHNGLFILQLGLLLALGRYWLAGLLRSPAAWVDATGAVGTPTALRWLAVSVLVGQLVAALPSLPLWRGYFAYELLSWFHVYVAFCTATMIFFLSRLRPTPLSAAAIGVIAVMLAAPMLGEIRSGLGFVALDLEELQMMPEARSWWRAFSLNPASLLTLMRDYSALIIVMPVVAFGMLVALIRSEDLRVSVLCTYGLLGLAMFAAQHRFHPYGSFVLSVPILFWLGRMLRPARKRVGSSVALALALIAQVPSLPGLARVPLPAFDYDYVLTRTMYDPLAQACQQRPGIVLASHNDGHYIRYHTECSVIANNLILSSTSREKVAESNRLLESPAVLLRQLAPCVRYVLVRREDNIFAPFDAAQVKRDNAGLRADLLFSSSLPDGFVHLFSLNMATSPTHETPLARLVEVERGDDAALCDDESR
jgi:hypothetical protein